MLSMNVDEMKSNTNTNTKRKEPNQDMFSAHGSQLASLLHDKEEEAAEQNHLKFISIGHVT